jgi:protein phosphatase 2C family protein 2/3
LVLPGAENCKCSIKASGFVSAYAANTNKGIIRGYNEDRVSIILNMIKPVNKIQSIEWPRCSFFGIFDGHGGNQ